MNEQEVFDTVVRHLGKQRAKALKNSSDCAYRTVDGKMCAVGCLIRDDEYHPDKNMTAVQLNENRRLPDRLKNVPIRFLQDLQNIHDNNDVGNWAFCLKNFAANNGLISDAVGEAFK